MYLCCSHCSGFSAFIIVLCLFKPCESIKRIMIPDSVTSISSYAFYGCTSLKTINFSGTKAWWNAISKGANWDSKSFSGGTPLTYTVYCTDGKIAKK